ncbi:hypothetical protein HNY73_001969 [Argiope bruennichi]|uniref:Uncharacterized protein n=1 Tax=Argiope bruennichi TaxID=94029 RepID=A0A8T0FWK4_ARGBR|nr:hypothetical protein HNY73_001969 [Argiope bruennichi]
MYQVLEGSGDQVEKFEIQHEVFDLEGPTSLEQFVAYKMVACSHTEDKRQALFNEFISSVLEYSLVSCVNRFSKVCREIDEGVMRSSAYLKKITESEECEKKEDAVKKPAVRNIFG